MIKRTVSSYTIIRLLGKGGMADVYYAENSLKRPAAVKILHPSLSYQPDVKYRFENEAQIMVTLDHPNIRKVYDVGEINGQPAIIMEYLEGHTLSEALSLKLLDSTILPDLFNQAVNGLYYAHQKGVVHRDIKPSNLFLTTEGQLKILDFGIAKAEEASSLTLTGQTLGTILYMSPEQIQDPKRVDCHTDIYSLGVTFFHLITGKPPYDQTIESTFIIQSKIVHELIDLSGLPLIWRERLTFCIAKNPAQRSYYAEQRNPETIVSLSPFTKVPTPPSTLKEKRTYFKKWTYIIGSMVVICAGFIGFRLLEKGKHIDSQYQKGLPPALIEFQNNMVSIEGGTFKMGCTSDSSLCSEDQYPVHTVNVPSFKISAFEVTQAQWRAIMLSDPSDLHFKECDNCPVEGVSWNAVQDFLEKLNLVTGRFYRLPSEAEWEYAARGGKKSSGFIYAGTNKLDSVGWYDRNSEDRTHPVGQKEPNELGLYDMSGNVWEMVQDCLSSSYKNSPNNGSAYIDSDCPGIIIRGGSWNGSIAVCPVSNRGAMGRNIGVSVLGFRLAENF